MKIIVVSIMAAALVLTVGTVSAFAAGSRFVDSNSDGVCDNWTATGKGQGNGNGQGFVDEDNDGVCDNWTATGKGQGNGNGRHMGCGR